MRLIQWSPAHRSPPVCHQVRLLQTNIHAESCWKCCSQVATSFPPAISSTNICAIGEPDFATNLPSLSGYWVMLRLGAGRMGASLPRSLLPRALRHQTSPSSSAAVSSCSPARQMWAITQARLTSAPFIYLNKITIRFIASRGKTSQGWNWSPILLNVDLLSWRQWRTEVIGWAS